jgi:CHAT domain-containing protein/tetratricopeptide (TPR) repeat protein
MKEARGTMHPDYAISLNNLALVYSGMGELARAEPLYRQALEITKQALGEKHPDCATKLSNLAEVYRKMGEQARAEPLYQQALEILKDSRGDRHPDYALTLSNLGLLYKSMEDYTRAELPYQEALNISRNNLESSALVQSERQQLAMMEDLRHRLDAYLSLAVTARRFEGKACEAWLGWKGMVARRQQAARAVMDDPKLAPKFAELEAAARELARKAFMTPEQAQQAAWQKRVAELSDLVERLQAELVATSAAYRVAKREVAMEDVQAALGGNVLVDYVEYWHSQPGMKVKGRLSSEMRIAAFVLMQEGAVKLLDLGSAEAIGSAVDAWREGFGGTQESREAGKKLRKMVWEPVEKVLAVGAPVGASPSLTLRITEKDTAGQRPAPPHVLVSPDGPLGRIPFAALPGKEEGTYLIEEWPIAVVPAAGALLNSQGEPVARTGATGGTRRSTTTLNLLVLGGFDYDADLGAISAREPGAQEATELFGRRHRAPRGDAVLKFEFLSGSRGEVATIKYLYGKKWGQMGLTSLDAAGASEEAFRKQAPRHLYLHVATHGFFAPESVKSALSRQTREMAAGATRLVSSQSIARYHPNLLSGLAFAGANKPPADGDDGILTAEEVEALDLRGVELVVLSACETGLGERAGGEGLLGLQRAFQVAGSKTVIASLWKVNDVATRDLMERFYDNLWNRKKEDGRPYGTLEALREAQLWMLKERGPRGLKEIAGDAEAIGAKDKRLPPYYWAAFVLSGDWR